jgi:AcrR family transcriptional regulator
MPRRETTPTPTHEEAEPMSQAAIVATATGLFATNGYANTTMSDIARAVGLHQSSLYYWFRRKEHILQAVFDSSRVPVDFLDSIFDGPGSAGLKLFRFIRFDTFRLCLVPCDANEIDRLAESQPEHFETYWLDRGRLHSTVADLIKGGVSDGEFVEVDPDLAALLIVSFNEGAQKRMRYQDAHRPGSGHRFTYPPQVAEVVAEETAATVVRGHLRRGAGIKKISRQAAGFDDVRVAREHLT